MRRWPAFGLATAAWGVLAGGFLLGLWTRAPELLAVSAAALPSAVLAGIITARAPHSPVSPALAWSAAGIVLVEINGVIASSSATTTPLPGSDLASHWQAGIWPVNLAGVCALLLVFPGGTMPRSRAWSLITRLLPWLYALGTVLVIAGLWDVRRVDGRLVDTGAGVFGPMLVLGITLVAMSATLAATDLAIRYTHSGESERRQIRWLMLAGLVVVALLAAGWLLQLAGLPLIVAYSPLLAATLILVPTAVAIAVLRHELFDVDWLMSSTLAWLGALLLSAGLFAILMFGIARSLPGRAAISVAVAAFCAALVLLPLHRLISTGVSQLLDRERVRAISAAERFTAGVRAGTRDPEEVEEVLRQAHGDPTLLLLIREPSADAWMRADGRPASQGDPAAHLVLHTGPEAVARIEFAHDSTRARRLTGMLAGSLALPIEICRHRVTLRRALAAAEESRTRLAQATAAERRRLERDLHDGAQQQVIGIALRLRALQLRLGAAEAEDLDRAVADLRATADELRRLAHGIRPSRLDDGLAAALAALQSTGPIPVTVRVEDLPDLDEACAATAYYLVAEAVTNALRHACPTRVTVRACSENGLLHVSVDDDGVGLPEGLTPTGLADRASSIGGELTVSSRPGGGAHISAVLPCAS